jgi:glycosyltransferase involved in cell wall biosynthesis
MIYYFGFTNPRTGGDFFNIEHVRCLNKNKIPCLLTYPGEKIPPDLGIKRISVNSIDFGKDDFLVIPENFLDLLEFSKKIPSKIIIHNQSSHYFLNTIPNIKYLDFSNLITILCPSESCAKMLKNVGYRKQIDVINPYIPDFFRKKNKNLIIACATAKRKIEARALCSAFKSMFPEHENIEWISLENMSRENVAQILSGAAIYVAFGYLESLSLSVLEAMASGCVIVGDHGGGGDNYANDENGLWVKGSQTIEFAKKVKLAVDIFLENGENNLYSKSAISTAQKFNYRIFENNLLSFWRKYGI